VSERRLVSVLFADLVGFTALSEHRDPEEVRELLSRYFDRCRSLIERYGGTVEKFIGDAVMAVWGTPIAREDDAERAVRAALSLTSAVTLLGEEVSMPGLQVRAGVLTGPAAVEVGAESEGMVLGDTVNTASRLQSIAPPGGVLVDEVTRRASDAAIDYEDAGHHRVRGRDQPVHAFTALRVVAGAGGARRADGLEAPFVGRDRELEQIITAAEQSAAEEHARLITLIGEAGTGKSRLLWECEKVMDGSDRFVFWHRGRCLSYGDGVAYWALAEMVRVRAGIAEEDGADSARDKLRSTVERFVGDERERRLVEPRLAHLLGLEQRTAPDRADLFSGWRLFIERMAEQLPVVLVFEDMQWADSGLLEFIDYLLEWSAGRSIFMLACGRPEVLERRPEWRRGTITLDPLGVPILRELLEGLVPGLPEELIDRILHQADGVPLYAVETVRMLIDRGRLVRDGARYVPTGDIAELEVPETLQALAAARLDGLEPAERSVIQDAAVLGQSFTIAGVTALGQAPSNEIERTLRGLVGKQLIGVDTDPLSADRGQYQFLQGLIRSTAYSTLSRRDRKARHLAAARHLQETIAESATEPAEVLAAHFLAAAAADPGAPDADRIRRSARETLEEAGQRALSLALPLEAQRAFDRAAELAELTEDDLTRAGLLAQAGAAAGLSGDHAAAEPRLTEAIAVLDAAGRREPAALARYELARSLLTADRNDEAITLLSRACDELPHDSAARAVAAGRLACYQSRAGETTAALDAAEACLAIAEQVRDWETIVMAFDAVTVVRRNQGRLEEARALAERALQIALQHDLARRAINAHAMLADLDLQEDRFPEALDHALRGIAQSHALGNLFSKQSLSLAADSARFGLGAWDALEPADPRNVIYLTVAGWVPRGRSLAARGDAEGLRRILRAAEAQSDVQLSEFADVLGLARAVTRRGLGDDRGALEQALPIALDPETLNEDRRDALPEAGHAALALGELETVQRLLDAVAALPLSRHSPVIDAETARLAGLLALGREDPKSAAQLLHDAARALEPVHAPFVLAQVLTERAEVLTGVGREAEAAPLLAEAAVTFEQLRAAPWLARVRSIAPAQPAFAPQR
jgi:class 3 adenylate cyclase/tetratricopeptide (TPR) repeat protein